MKLLHVFMLSIMLSAQCFADTDAHWAKAEKFVSLSGATQLISGLLAQLELELEQGTEDLYIGLTTEYFMPPEIQVHLNEYEEEAKTVMQRIFNIERITQELIPMYMAHFTEAEFDELIAFFESPIGKAFVERQPAIFLHSQELGDARMREYMQAMEPINMQLNEKLGIVQ